jgi:hypothetical protein|nr:MAG TPA_asm: hypothetical protein [Caudoviricetes sp.]
MSLNDLEKKQLILIKYLNQIISYFTTDKWLVKAEYSTNDNDKNVVVVQEQSGQKEVFYGDIFPLYNYYMVDIYGLSIEKCKNLSLMFGNLIGKSITIEDEVEEEGTTYIDKWQIIFSQYVNPQTVNYLDIKRIAYTSTLKCIVNKVYRKEK